MGSEVTIEQNLNQREREREENIPTVRRLLKVVTAEKASTTQYDGVTVAIESNSFAVWNETYGLKISYAGQSLSINERENLENGVVSDTALLIDNNNLITFETKANKPDSKVITPSLTEDQQNKIIDGLLERALGNLQAFNQQTQLNTTTLPIS